MKTLLIESLENYINKYVTLADKAYTLPIVLWAIGTHCYDLFDAYPYLIITAFTPGSGKTRLMEVISYVSRAGKTFSAKSSASMFAAIMDRNSQSLPEIMRPDMFIDECEELNRPQHEAREFLNKGYKRGQTVTRAYGDIQAYCPKCFVLIGQVYDTLKDRSIVVVCRKRTLRESREAIPFRTALVEPQAAELKKEIGLAVAEMRSEIEGQYLSGIDLTFMTNDRDAEIWQSLFVVCRVLCPERERELVRIAVDMCMDKASDYRKSSGEDYEREKLNAENESMSAKLVEDLLAITEGKDYVFSDEVIDNLKAIATSPWRKYKLTGLTNELMGHLLKPIGLKAENQRVGKRSDNKVNRAYKREAIESAARKIGLIE